MESGRDKEVRMNVLYISHDSGLYGATRSLLNLMDELCHYGVVPYVILPYPGEIEKELKRKKIKYKILKINKNYRTVKEQHYLAENISEVKNMKIIIEMVRLVKEWKIDLIHTNNLCIEIGAIVSILCRRPHIWHLREFMEEDFNIEFHHKRKMKYLLNKADSLVAISKSIYSKYSRLYNADKMSLVYNGFPLNEYLIDRNIYFSENTISILLCGAISKEKGQLEAVKAVEYLLKMGNYDIKLYLVGSGKPEYINKIKKYIKSRNLYHSIIILGFHKDMKVIRQKMDIALVCSKSEAFGRVTVESMLSELLVIGANTAGTYELVTDKKTGFLYEKGNYIDLANKIEYAIKNKEVSTKIIKNAKLYAADTFSISSTGEHIFNIYKNVSTKGLEVN